ncbi:MAG: response regulator [Nitrospirae bacterium]|nr:response regulator [Nitrospirota bacterium]
MDKKPFIEKILVIENDQTVRDFLRDLFSMKGYIVKTASKGREAIDILSVEYFPVILADLILPDLRGTAILDHVEQQGLSTAVLIVTAYRSIDLVIEALRHGAYDYITKPFAPQILLHRVAMAMEKIRMEEIARDLSSRIVYATEEERRRISRDIHDGIGQSLAIIKLTLKAIRNKLIDSAEIIADIDGLATHVEETMEEVSRITKNLNPSCVTEVGFLHALRLYLETFSKKTGIQIHADVSERLSFQDVEQEIHLYRIAQEALTNIAKHSGATKVNIRLDLEEDHILFSIADNGKGFDEPQEKGKCGLGLIGMRERAAILGGKVYIESLPGQGTTVRTEVPYGSSKSPGVI